MVTAVKDYRDEDRPNKSVRFRLDTRHVIETHAREEPRSDFTALVNRAAEAVELGIVRCDTCGYPVPLELGNLEGMTLREAVSEAKRTATKQNCKAHAPVRAGSGEPVSGEVAAMVEEVRAKVEQIRKRMTPVTEPGSVPFRSPAVTR